MTTPSPLAERLADGAVHVSIDMQRLFAEPGEWHVPTLDAITANGVALAGAMPTLFARFVVPHTPEDAEGRWKHYYRRWHMLTGEKLPAGMLDLVAPLAALATPATTFDKPTYSIFKTPAFREALAATGKEVIVVSGVETDVCVLGTVLDALDAGYHVVVATDAMTSSSLPAHQATIAHVFPRFDVQIDIADTATILAALPGRP